MTGQPQESSFSTSLAPGGQVCTPGLAACVDQTQVLISASQTLYQLSYFLSPIQNKPYRQRGVGLIPIVTSILSTNYQQQSWQSNHLNFSVPHDISLGTCISFPTTGLAYWYPQLSENIWHLSFCVGLVSPIIIFSRFY